MNFEQMIGFGVAGNFAGHLEQAGEAADFTQVKTESAIQPKAIFPFYVPSEKAGFLSTYPLSHNQINFPQGADNLQIEPEIALICDLIYKGKQVSKLSRVILQPIMIALFVALMRKKSVKRKTGARQVKVFHQNLFHFLPLLREVKLINIVSLASIKEIARSIRMVLTAPLSVIAISTNNY